MQFYDLNIVENFNGFWQWNDKQENVINANNSQSHI